jgi:hypothetical protein
VIDHFPRGVGGVEVDLILTCHVGPKNGSYDDAARIPKLDIHAVVDNVTAKYIAVHVVHHETPFTTVAEMNSPELPD